MARSFGFFGRTAQAFAVVPYGWGQVTGAVQGTAGRVDRAGLADLRLRMAVLLKGAPAASLSEIAKAPRRTILGVSLTASAPSGQLSSARLINVGANRWAFKPEFAVSRPFGSVWLLDAYAGGWLFTTNDTYFPGTAVRSQAPLGSLPGHFSHSFRRQLWAAFDATWYVGGHTTVQGVANDDRQSNARVGATLVLPVGQRHSIKLAVAKGAIVRIGSDLREKRPCGQCGMELCQSSPSC